MQRLLLLFLSLAFWTAPQVAHAQVPLGSVVATFPYHASKVLADPYRSRVYVTDVDTNSVVAIDTVTMKVVGVLPTGSKPADMAISRDGKLLYVANSSSTFEAIDLIDLSNFTELNSFSLAKAVVSIAAGLNNRVYAGTTDVPGTIYQLDGITGVVQDTIPTQLYRTDFLQITPDGHKLFGAESGLSFSNMQSFDVSASAAVSLQYLIAGENSQQLVVSHHGDYLCLPCGGGNTQGYTGTGYDTFLYSTVDLTTFYGVHYNGPYPGALAFSPDDDTIYQVTLDNVQVYNTRTFQSSGSFALPRFTDYSYSPLSLVTDNTGSYLFVCQTGSDPKLPGTFENVGRVVVFGTGGGNGLPGGPAVVNITAKKPNVVAGSGDHGVIEVSRLRGDFSQPLVVRYLIEGTAENGTDYTMLTGTKRIPAGRTNALIEVVPGDDIPGYQMKTVRLSLQHRPGYEVGAASTAVVRIRAPQ